MSAVALFAFSETASGQGPPTTAAPTPASPERTEAAPPRRDAVRAPLDAPLELNGKFLGSISVEVDLSGAGSIDAKRLVALLEPVLSAEATAALTTRIAGRDRADFAELSGDGFTIDFDPGALTVRAAVPVGRVAERSIRLVDRSEAPDPSRFDPQQEFATGLNISVGQRFVHGNAGGAQPLRGSAAGFVNLGGFDGYTLTGGVDYDGSSEQRLRRREFRLTKDFYRSAVRVTAGEFTADLTGFQGTGRVLGLSIARAYETIRPFQNVRPLGRESFTLERSSTIEVYVNDIRNQTLQLEPGRYNVGDFPFAAGSNRVRLVVQDVSGSREIATFDVFNDVNLLEPGVVEFSAAAGLREGSGSLVYDGGVVGSGFVFRGVTDSLTVGGHAEASRSGQQVGVIGAVGLPIGFAQAEAAASRGETGAGWAFSLDYRGTFSLLNPSDFRATFSAVYRSERFRNAFVEGGPNLVALQVAALAQWTTPVGLGVGLGYSLSTARGSAANSRRYDVSLGQSFGRVGLNGTVSRVQDGQRRGWLAAVGLSVRLTPRLFATARYGTDTARREAEIARPSSGQLDDVSGELRYNEDRAGRGLAGRVAYINNRFDAELRHDRTVAFGPGGAESTQTSWNVATGIGYADGVVAVGRAFGTGFLIATRHRSLDDSRLVVKSGDRVLARSGLYGPALVPIDRSYGAQRFQYQVDPLPPGYDLGSGAVSIFPGFGAGYRTQVGSDASRIAVGILSQGGKPLSLIGGTVELVGAQPPVTRPFFTNRSGRFVADRLAPGRYRILIGGEPKAEFEVGQKQEGMVDVGTITVRD